MKIIKHNQLEIDDELLTLCEKMYSKEKFDKEWGEIELCDTFQTPTYCGDYDAIEQEFRFSYYDTHTKEWWFELTLESLRRIIHGDLKFIDLYKPNNQSN